MNRRNFFKFFGKSAAVAATAAVIGLPEIENEPNVEAYEQACPGQKNEAAIQLLRSWRDGDEQEQRDTMDILYSGDWIDLTDSEEITYDFNGNDLPYVGASLEQWQKMVTNGDFEEN